MNVEVGWDGLIYLPSGLVLRTRGVCPPLGAEIIETRDVSRDVTVLWFRLVPDADPILLGEVAARDRALAAEIEIDWDALFLECQRRYPKVTDGP